MFLKFIFYLFVLKSAFGFGLRYPGTGNPWRQGEYEYNHLLSGWIKLHEEPVDWLTARVNCHSEGAFLYSPWSTDFTRAIRDVMERYSLFSRKIDTDMMWSGVHTTFDEGALKSVNGKTIVSLQHDDLVPLERCGVFRSYSMDQVPCDRSLPYICYRPGPSAPLSFPERPISPPELNSYEPSPEFLPSEQTPFPTEVISKTLKKLSPSSTELPLTEPAPTTEAALVVDSSKCGDESLGYKFAELTGHCYKFHAHAIHTWDLAKSACEEEGAYLAIVNSDDEVKVLKKIYAKKIYGAPYPDTAAIGFYNDWGTWKTLEGESIESAGYAKWRPEAPHFSARLGFIARDGLLYGYTTDVRDVPYICEKAALNQEVNHAIESIESKTVSAELEEGIVPVWKPVTEADESIESTSVTTEEGEAIPSIWNTESVSTAGETDEAIASIWNTESVSTAGETDEAISTIWNTEPVSRAGETDEAISSKWNTESASAAGETDEAVSTIWNTEPVSRAGETDEAISSKWNTESVPGEGETDDEAILSKWNTEYTDTQIDDRESEEYAWHYPDSWYNGNNGYRGRSIRIRY